MSIEDDDRIDGLAQLRRTRAPERELWPQIEARLAARGRRRWPLAQAALAASLVAALAVSFSLGLPPGGARISAPETEVAAASPVRDAPSRAIVKANLGIVRQAERQLQAAIVQNPESASLRALLASTQTRQRELSALL